MQFKYPELLYALLLLLIPIIIHLFQLRRFEKVPFTNVQFLKSITIQTRKSSQLKKWLTLLTRLLLIAAVVLAFAQPYFSKSNSINLKSETVIYLDNSFSMQAQGEKGELLKRSIQDIISAIDDTNKITIFTNDDIFKDITRKTINNELLDLDYSSNQLDYNAAVLKGEKLFDKKMASVKNLILLSDFQQKNKPFAITTDKSIATHLVQLQPLNNTNISIDSVYISKHNISNIELTVVVKSQGSNLNDISISLFNNTNLIAKSSVQNDAIAKTTFTLPANVAINGKITIEDTSLQFDNVLYFNINTPQKTNVLSINSTDDDFLKRVFTNDEFKYSASAANQLNYNDIEEQDLIILNELDKIPLSLINTLHTFINNGGYLLIIPSNNAALTSYNQLFNSKEILFKSLRTSEKKITTINYSHPIFKGVFDKEISNFQYPKVNSFYELQSASNAILQFEDNKPFLFQKGTVFVFAAALNTTNSNFKNSPLIVPTLYNIGRQSLQLPKLYYTIGEDNTYDVDISLQQDDILKLKSAEIEIIPLQHTFSNKVTINTSETPSIAGIYEIRNSSTVIKRVSYNYNRIESNLNYLDLSNIEHVNLSQSIPQVFNSIKSETNVNALWKWFTIFALLLLIIEMLILKYFK
jgi:Aerotolerance regulator N-terminal